MFVFDVETLGKESNSVILSMAAIYFDTESNPTYEELINDAFFVKFNVEDQIKRLNRKVGKSTMEWWAKQCDLVKEKSFKPSKNDVIFENGYESMRQWVKSKNDDKCWVFARGNLDQLVLDSMEEQLELKPIWYFNRWRDVRTAVDFLCGTENGYENIPNFDEKAKVIKHDPVHDCAYDVMMLLYGKNKEK